MASNTPKSHALIEFQRRLFASRFFTVSVLIHFIIVLTFGSTQLVKQYVEAPDFSGDEGGGFVSQEAAPQAPVIEQQPTEPQPEMEVTTNVMNTQSVSFDAITSNSMAEPTFSIPTISAPVLSPSSDINTGLSKIQAPTISGDALNRVQLSQIKNFTEGWVKKGSGGGPGSDPRQREFMFTAYLAQYGDPRDPQRMGNWASTNEIKDGKIVRGSLPNLLYFMNTASRDRIQAHPNAVPLDLSSQEIFAKKPPFIFFTGHRDFVLTETEVENLRKYVTLGGCIWGDSSLPGRRSRFDIAFRREMRRVIPDTNKEWEVLPERHALYTSPKNLYFKEITKPPPGLNYYEEPVYVLKFGGEVAVIYTANDYGDVWRIALTDKFQYDLSRDEREQFIVTSRQVWDWRGVYYRNLSEPAVYNAYKFGTNVVIHLLTRWEDKVRNVPAGLQ